MISEAVDSVLQQTYRPIEIILVDDGSTDTTPEVLRRIADQHPDEVRICRQENAGPGAARNTGLQLARGELVQYLDSDDLLDPRKFELQAARLREHPEAGVCYCITLRHDPRSDRMAPWARTAESITDIFPSFLPKRGWATLTPLWRRSVCDRVGPWKSYRVMEDWEHDLRAGLLGVTPVGVAEELCTVRDHEEHRASGMNDGLTPERARDMLLAHESVWDAMKQADRTDWSYVAPLASTVTWLSRLCGQNGMTELAERGLVCADDMTNRNNRPPVTRMTRMLRASMGWSLAAKTVDFLSAVRRKTRSLFGLRKVPA